jgi:hypothetical protein
MNVPPITLKNKHVTFHDTHVYNDWYDFLSAKKSIDVVGDLLVGSSIHFSLL